MSPIANDWDPKSAWSPYAPSDKAPWDLRRVVHLHRRAGFAATWGELQRDLRDGPHASIDRLFNGRTREAVPAEFDRVAGLLADNTVRARDAAALKAWWMYRMSWG